jgi:hypothetical protein
LPEGGRSGAEEFTAHSPSLHQGFTVARQGARMNSSDLARFRVRGAAAWVRYLRENAARDWTIPWQAEVTLSAATRARIGPSIAEFQRGESSEAHAYLRKSRAFAEASGDAMFHEASVLFVREENGHSALLDRFMRDAGIPRRERAFSDMVFRWLRSGGDLGWSSRVLLIAELIAQEYYPCLRRATSHPALVRICDKIICDEEAHIAFQVQRIAEVEAGLGALARAWRANAQRVLMIGAALVVYRGHGGVLTPHMSRVAFVRRSLARLEATIEAIVELQTRGVGRFGSRGLLRKELFHSIHPTRGKCSDDEPCHTRHRE